MELNDSDIPETAFLCSLYSVESNLDITSLACTRIKSGAVPFVCIDIELISWVRLVSSILYFVKEYIFLQQYLSAKNDESSVEQRKILNEHSIE